MIEVTFPAGFTPAESTRVSPEPDPLSDQLRQASLLGNDITGTRPVRDTNGSSSNNGVALAHR
ncbi:MAG: hypothetical protein H0U61_09835 [Nocardioidaceae bacterium]|nr:hypothetical protein [Nocardioidaceae bacterium]